MQVDLAARARRDLVHIYNYIGVDHLSHAEEWFNQLEEEILSLSHFPLRGSMAPEDQRFKQVLYGKKPHVYRIIYRIEKKLDIVRIMQIRHGARHDMHK